MGASFLQSVKTNRLLIGAVILSFIINCLRIPLLNGTFAALVVAVVLQLYLPGYLLARRLGKSQHPHPIVRFAWILLCGLSLTICLGALARLLPLPVPLYLAALHLLMLVLAVSPVPTPADTKPWRLTRGAVPLYILVAVSCVVALGVGYESRQRFYGFEDQPIFISLVDWIVHHPDILPNDVPLRSRQIGVLNGDSRFDTDGFSYNQAAWVWASGVTGAQLIWYDLGTLFVWTVPLITFALAYELSGRERAAAWCAGALVLVGLMTLDNIVYHSPYTAFGRFAVFQVNTLRQASITFMLPLALMAALSYLRTFRRRDLLLIALGGIALATMHPIQITLFVMAVMGTLALSWLASPTRDHLKKLLPLALVVAAMLAIPYIQRFNRVGTSTTVSNLVNQEALADDNVTTTGYFLILRDLPILGTTYIRDPGDVFYHPAITLAVVLGLASVWWWRRSVVARYTFATTLTAALLFFTPGLAEFYNKFISTVGVLTTMFLIPIPIIFGFALDNLLRLLSQRRTPDKLSASTSGSPQYSALVSWLPSALALLVMGLLLFEPFPIPASARDQLNAYNAMQSLRYLHPAQMALSDSLRQHLPADDITVLVTPYDVANVVIEDLHSTLITGGRHNRNLASSGNRRFFNEVVPYAPWLDAADLAWLGEFGATHIITLADTTRLPQMRLRPDRFRLLDSPAGYTVFEVQPGLLPDAGDAIYARMNDLYAGLETPRWGRDGFNLILPGDSGAWDAIAADWRAMLDANPDDDRARLGLAFTYLMMGRDADALPLWSALHDRYPDEPLYADALPSVLAVVDPAQDSIAPLIDSLSSDNAATRVLAARRLLTDTFFYRLSDEQLAQIFLVTEADPITWDRLANLGRDDELRRRVALIMDRSEWAKAREWLDALPVPERSPEDVTAQAAAALALGDVDGALAVLRPSTDPDGIAANVFLHADRWENNTAAQMYYLLLGELAARDGREADAEAAYRQAESYGYTPHPDLVSPLTIADTGMIYATQPQVTYQEDERILVLTAAFGGFRPRNAYPIQSWRFQIVSPDSATQYAELDVPAEFVDGALLQVSTTLPLPDDIPELTPALVFIEPRYNDAVTADPLILPIVLNRPDSAAIPPDAEAVNVQFQNETGIPITLEAYTVEGADQRLNLTLYWRVENRLMEDYQVFVHVLDADGQQVGGEDSAPVNNRYPTTQWRAGVTIADPHALTFDPPLPPGDYRVQIGLYRLSDFARLAISPPDERARDNALVIYQYSLGN